MLCEHCQSRQATCHLNEIAEGNIRTTDLCSECFQARKPEEEKQLRSAAQAARCKYCGRAPCVEWNSLTNLFGVIVADGRPDGFLCEPCTEEYNRFLAHEMEGLPQGLSEAEESTIARRMRASGEKHMLEWVARTRL